MGEGTLSFSVGRLESLQRFGWNFGLETTRDLLERLGNPQQSLKFIHVAGTNGKGSTCAYLESILRTAGYRTGLYTSPHLTDPRERFRVDGRWISSRDYARLASRVLRACDEMKRAKKFVTYFEAHTVLAALWFQERRTDVVVWETGLGGRLDATNIIDRPLVSLVTPISLEHADILGSTIQRIAFEKAGILKRGCWAATLQRDSAALRVLKDRAQKIGAYLSVAGMDFPDRVSPGSNHPSYDEANAALAVAGIRLLSHHGLEVTLRQIRAGLSAMRWPGRFECLPGPTKVLLDGAHNPDAARALAGALRDRYPGKKWIVLNGFLADKDYRSSIRQWRKTALVAVVTNPPSARAGSGERVFETWEALGIPAVYISDWRKALRLAQLKSGGKTGLLVTGSLYLIGACREVLIGTRGLRSLQER